MEWLSQNCHISLVYCILPKKLNKGRAFEYGVEGMFGKKKKRKGMGLKGVMGLGVVAALAFGAGGGDFLKNMAGGLGNACFATMGNLGFQAGMSACEAGGSAVSGALESIGNSLANFKESVLPTNVNSMLTGMADKMGMDVSETFANSNVTGSVDFGLMEKIKSGLATASAENLSASEMMKRAFAEGTLASQLLNGEGGMPQDKTAAVGWLKHSAGLGDYGVLSQLSLANMFMKGDVVPANVNEAFKYNNMALASVKSLQGAGTPEANAMLKTLPMDPNKLVAELTKIAATMKPHVGK